jgi:hypothetical protein
MKEEDQTNQPFESIDLLTTRILKLKLTEITSQYTHSQDSGGTTK